MHASAGLTHLQLFVDRLKQSIETRFEYLFSYDSDANIFSAAAVSRPTFKRRWVLADRQDWLTDVFIEEAVRVKPCAGETE
jgi:hypothetical protein